MRNKIAQCRENYSDLNPGVAGTGETRGTKKVKLGTPKETFPGENRVAMTPESAVQLQKLGYECAIEAG
ncbi:hypothetical protein RA21_20295, partial [Leisingera sp. ANG-DT]|uniref:hypothetical protein n=1 Tax=Leisingera sp. ANG-DT TaxID=1577897 RepID=UPI0005834DEB